MEIKGILEKYYTKKSSEAQGRINARPQFALFVLVCADASCPMEWADTQRGVMRRQGMYMIKIFHGFIKNYQLNLKID